MEAIFITTYFLILYYSYYVFKNLSVIYRIDTKHLKEEDIKKLKQLSGIFMAIVYKDVKILFLLLSFSILLNIYN